MERMHGWHCKACRVIVHSCLRVCISGGKGKGGWWRGVTVLSAAAVGQSLPVQAEESRTVNNTQ